MTSESTSKPGGRSRGKPKQGIARDITNPKRAEEVIVCTQTEWERTFNALPDLLAILDNHHRIVRVNQAMVQRLGLIPDQCIGKLCYQVVHGLDSPPDFCPHALTITDGREHMAEVHEDSLGGDFLVSTTPLTDEHGMHMGSVHVARNITKRKEMEKALREKQKDLDHAQFVAKTGSWRLDVRRNELQWSDETYRIFGIPKGTPLRYETFLDAVHPDDRNYVDQKWKAALQGEPYDIEHRIIVGREVKWVRERAEMEFDPEGLLVGGFGIIHDCTERKQAEEALREAHKRANWLARFPEENPNPVMRVSADGWILYCNPAAAKLPAWKGEVGKAPPNWLNPLVSGAMATGEEMQHEAEVDGRVYFVCIVPVPGEFYANVYGRDVTERKEAEEALRERTLELQHLTETLEQRVEERTAEITALSSQLVSAQENERRRVSYDLHDNVWQNLVAIRFDIESLFSGQDNWAVLQNKSKKIMADILNAVEKIRSTQGDLWPYVLDDIGLLATIDWYCREFEKNHSGLDIEKQINLAESEVPSSLKIVVYRLMQETLNNAARHSQANHIILSLNKNAHRIELSFKDNGIGFDPEEAIAKRAPWGGLGLLNIKARAELSGGIFGVESAKGKGTSVWASWPI